MNYAHKGNDKKGITPQIEFALRKDGELTASFSLLVPCGQAVLSGSHPFSREIDYLVFKAVNDAHHKKRMCGFFTSSFRVRYALRDSRGKILYLSPPEVKIANPLPPLVHTSCVAVSCQQSMYFEFKGSACFSLMIRVADMPSRWTDTIKGIDIYVSPQIQVCQYGHGYVCTYSDVVRNISYGADIDMLNDRYSDYMHISHANTPVWYVAPNQRLSMSDEEVSFHRIASVSLSDIDQFKSFKCLPIVDTSGIEDLELLDEGAEIIHDDTPQSSAVISSGKIALSWSCVQALACLCQFPGFKPLSLGYIKNSSILRLFFSGLSPPRLMTPVNIL